MSDQKKDFALINNTLQTISTQCGTTEQQRLLLTAQAAVVDLQAGLEPVSADQRTKETIKALLEAIKAKSLTRDQIISSLELLSKDG